MDGWLDCSIATIASLLVCIKSNVDKNQPVGYIAAMDTKGDKTKRRILTVAAELFWKRSYRGLNMGTISEAAGVNKATVYSYFPSKEALAIATIENYRLGAKAIFEQNLQATSNPIEQLERTYQHLYRVARTAFDRDGVCPGCPFVNILMEMATESPQIREAVRVCFDDFGAYYLQVVRAAKQQGIAPADLDEAQAVKGLIATTNGAMVASKVQNSPEEILALFPIARRILEG